MAYINKKAASLQPEFSDNPALSQDNNLSIDLMSEGEIAEEANYPLLYNNNEVSQMNGKFYESFEIVNDIIDQVLENGGKRFYDFYIDEKIPQHSNIRTLDFLSQQFRQEFFYNDELDPDMKNDGLLDDSEPEPVIQEYWKRLTINVEKKQEKSQQDVPRGSAQIDVKLSRISYLPQNMHKLASQQIINTTEQPFSEDNFKYQYVDMSIPVEFDLKEEQMRVIKEREIKLRNDKIQMEVQRSQELKEQQIRLKGAISDSRNKKQLTYDFDGRIIPIIQVKLEKLPNTILQLNHNIQKGDELLKKGGGVQPDKKNSDKDINYEEQIQQGDKQKQRKSQLIAQQQITQQQLQLKQIENSNNINQQKIQPVTAGQVFEQFNLRQGVTLYDGAKTRKGPKFQSNVDVTNLEKLSVPNQSIRMTKTEYQELTRIGNLSRTNNTIQKEGSMLTNDKRNTDDIEKSILGDISKNNYTSIISQSLKKNKLISASQGSIKIQSKKYLQESIQDSILDNAQSMQANLTFQKQLSQSQSQSKLDRTPMDDFNQSLLSKQNDNKQQHYNDSVLSLPPIVSTKPKAEELRTTLGILTKKPRDRLTYMASNALSFSHLPPPAVGRTIGHGLCSGYNLDNPETIEQILEKINNTTQNQINNSIANK